MALVVNTNIASMNAQRSLAYSSRELGSAMERLSSGKKINSAADDAAGFAIAETMTSQVRGLNMAVKNVNDGQALLAVIENATQDVTDMLQRIRELAVQAASDTNSNTQRDYLNTEVHQLLAEIDRVATKTQYNGLNVLDGSFKDKLIQVGVNDAQTVKVSVADLSMRALGLDTADIRLKGNSIFGNAGDFFGAFMHLSADGNTLAVGLPYADPDESGRVDVYAWDGSSWQSKGYAIGLNATDHTGASVHLSADGDTLVVGSPGANTDNGDDSGHVKVYDWDESSNDWVPRGNSIKGIAENDNLGAEYSGIQLSADGNTLVFGAPASDTDNGINSGHVKVYAWNESSNNWDSRGNSIKGDEAHANLGENLHLSADGDTLVVGSPWSDDQWVKVYDWDESTNDWDPRENSIIEGDTVGKGIALTADGNTLVVGAASTENGPYSGRIDTYAWNGLAWLPKGDSLFGNAGEYLGDNLQLSADGNTLVVGLPYADENGVVESGRVDVYAWDESSSSWQHKMDLARGVTEREMFGDLIQLSADGKTLAVGVGWSDENGTNSGRVDVYSIPDAIDLVSEPSEALTLMSATIKEVSTERAKLGALQNRFEYMASNLMNIVEFTSAARSRIEDADFAVETARLAKAQVLQQSGTAMLSQANAAPTLVLSLLEVA